MYWEEDLDHRESVPTSRNFRIYSALVWLFGGSGLPRWCPVEKPKGWDAWFSFTSGRTLNPVWKLRSKTSVGAKDRGFSSSSPFSLACHAFSIASLAAGGEWPIDQKIWGARTWKPQKRRTPFCIKTQFVLFQVVLVYQETYKRFL